MYSCARTAIKEATFDVSKLTVFCVEVYSNEESIVEDMAKASEKALEEILEAMRLTTVGLSRMLDAR